ncbi:MAG TPA: glycosyltransferase [Caulobacteraceae bacterium]|jgi:glycosyltransferase involved in cell wall biosynthesis|nr:glycosyltransferase [Caulobacteraceae bacterium]
MLLSLADELIAAPGPAFANARICFWSPHAKALLTVEPAQVGPLVAFFPSLAGRYDAAGLVRIPYVSQVTRAVATSLPRALRYRLFPADSGVGLFELWAQRSGVRLTEVDLDAGDSLFLPGSFWLGDHMGPLFREARAAGASVTAFVHDMLLLSHPEWRPGAIARRFRRGCQARLPRCAAVICNSRQTASELRRLIRLPAELAVEACRFADIPQAAPGVPPAALERLAGAPYVLVVSTLIPRKNHQLLVEAWRELWRRHGPATPYLVFAGGGAPDRRLAEVMAAEAAEGGRLLRLGGVDDAALERLYADAWLTAYPSLGEGYGLPVAEALSRGKVCLAGPVEGVSEAGAGLIDLIDPRAPQSVVAAVSGYLAEPARLAARMAEIAAGYRRTSWAQTAATVRAVLENTVAGPR